MVDGYNYGYTSVGEVIKPGSLLRRKSITLQGTSSMLPHALTTPSSPYILEGSCAVPHLSASVPYEVAQHP